MSDIPQSSVDTVIAEIQNAVAQAQESLSEYYDEAGDISNISYCQQAMHQIYGALVITGVAGAAEVALELERSLQYLHANADSDESQDLLCNAVMGGMIRLPIYLDLLQTGRKPAPKLLHNIINELRLLRGESVLLNGSTQSADSRNPRHAEISSKMTPPPDIFVKFRTAFDKNLLSFLQGKEVVESIKHLHRVLKLYEKLAVHRQQETQWWLSFVLVECLRNEGLSLDNDLKKLFMKIGNTVRQLAKKGEAALENPVDPVIVEQCLHYIKQSTYQSHLVEEVLERMATEAPADALDSEDALTESGEHDMIPVKEAMLAVTLILREEIAALKDALDIYHRSESMIINELEPAYYKLLEIRKILVMLNLPAPLQALDSLLQVAKEIRKEPTAEPRSRLAEVARGLLYIESTLENAAIPTTQIQAFKVGEQEDALSDDEKTVAVSQLYASIRTVLLEIQDIITKSKARLVDFCATESEAAADLGDTPELMASAAGACALLQFDKAAEVLASCAQTLNTLLEDETDKSCARDLAEPITLVEHYIDCLLADKPVDDTILTV